MAIRVGVDAANMWIDSMSRVVYRSANGVYLTVEVFDQVLGGNG